MWRSSDDYCSSGGPDDSSASSRGWAGPGLCLGRHWAVGCWISGDNSGYRRIKKPQANGHVYAVVAGCSHGLWSLIRMRSQVQILADSPPPRESFPLVNPGGVGRVAHTTGWAVARRVRAVIAAANDPKAVARLTCEQVVEPVAGARPRCRTSIHPLRPQVCRLTQRVRPGAPVFVCLVVRLRVRESNLVYEGNELVQEASRTEMTFTPCDEETMALRRREIRPLGSVPKWVRRPYLHKRLRQMSALSSGLPHRYDSRSHSHSAPSSVLPRLLAAIPGYRLPPCT